MVLEALGIVVGGALVVAFTAWAVSVIAAVGPILLIGAALTGLIALVIKAYRENETFRNGVDAVGRWIRDKLVPALADLWGWIRDNILPVLADLWAFIRDHLVPILVDVATKIGEWSLVLAEILIAISLFVADVLVFISELIADIIRAGVDIFNALTGPFSDAIEWIEEKWTALRRFLGQEVETKIVGGGGSRYIGKGGGGSFDLRPTRTRNRLGGPQAAMGTGSHTGGDLTVGERGPERVYLPRGSRVEPAHLNRGGSGSGGDTFVINGANTSATELAREIAWLKRVGDGR